MFLTPEELMAGKEMTFDLEIPAAILRPSLAEQQETAETGKKIRLRPLTVHDVQRIAKAAKDDEILTSVLMIQKSLLEPILDQSDIAKMHSGLVRYLVDAINRISGLSTSDDDIQEMVNAPIVRAFFVLAKEFNWTPQQVRELTVGQIMGYLELLNQSKRTAQV